MPRYTVDIELNETRTMIINAKSLVAARAVSEEYAEEIRNGNYSRDYLIAVSKVEVSAIEEIKK